MKFMTHFLPIMAMIFASCTPSGVQKRYVASKGATSVVYTITETGHISPYGTIQRGTQVEVNFEKEKEQGDTCFYAVFIGEKQQWIAQENLVNNLEDIVLESSLTMRSPASIIDDTVTSHIAGLAKAEQTYQIIGYDTVLPDGNVNRYHIKEDDKTGWVYAKYTHWVEIPEVNMAYYDSIHSKVRNTFGGGKAGECDYYPVQKPSFSSNKMPDACYSLYLNISPAVIGKIDQYISLAKQTKINTFVIDIKDNECPAYKAEAMAKYSPTNYQWGGKNKEAMYQYAVKRLKEEGFYVVARITCFKDSYFIKDHPECAITDRATGQPFFHNKAYWPSAYNRQVWQFNVELAKEVIRKFGFNEINFDYVRFPDKLQSVADQIDYHNTYNESKIQAIQRFVQYACDEIHALEAYVSIDVFGESANKGYTTPYGQYWPAISNVADVMCGMPYPDHFANGYAGIAKPWNNPYATMKAWGKSVVSRQAETTSPAKVRTWIQAYPVLKYVDPNGIRYNASEVTQEIRGLYDAGLTDGYITWLSSSSLERYTMLAPAFTVDYINE